MIIDEIVFPVDFSDLCVAACPYVAAVSKRLRAKVTLLHVVEHIPAGSSASNKLDTDNEREIEERKGRANFALTAFQRQFIPQVTSEAHVFVGDPADAIVAYGGETRSCMIVMPTRGYGRFRRMLIGSITAKVLHDAKCPVLTGPHLEKAIQPTEWFSLRRILAAVALTWETDQVLKWSGELAKDLGAQLIVFHVVAPTEEGMLALATSEGPPLSPDSARGVLEGALKRVGQRGEVHIAVGEVSREVARAAKEHQSDVVIIGRGGDPGASGRFGSRAYAIVRKSPCPVLCL
jgi:nucleotide-binding universal stress UspA family protein